MFPRVVRVAILAVVGCAAAVHAQTDEEALVLEAHLAVGRAVVTNDTRAFAALTTDEFISISERGEMRTKQQRVNELEAAAKVGRPTGPAPTSAPPEWHVALYGDVAVTTYRRDTSNPPARLMRIFVKRHGRWLMAASQITSISQLP